MGLFIKFRNSLKKKRKISFVDLKSYNKIKKSNNDLVNNHLVDNDEDFVINIDNFFIDRREVKKNRYNDWIDKNIDSNESNRNNSISQNNNVISQIPKGSVMHSIPFDVFGNRKVYSSFHNNTEVSNEKIDEINNLNNKNEFYKINDEINDSNHNKINTIYTKSDVELEKNKDNYVIKKEEICNNNSFEKIENNLTNKTNKTENFESSNSNFNFSKTSFFNTDKFSKESKEFINDNKSIKNPINNNLHDLDLEIEIDEGQMSIERKIQQDKLIVLNQDFVLHESNKKNQKNEKVNFSNAEHFHLFNEMINKFNNPSNISKVQESNTNENIVNNTRNMIGEIESLISHETNEDKGNSFRFFFDKKYDSYESCILDGNLFKKILLDDFKNDKNYEKIKEQFKQIYKLRSDRSVTGYIGELIFYKILTEKDKNGTPIFKDLISSFFDNLPERFFKHKKHNDMLIVDWKSLTNKKNDTDFYISFLAEKNEDKFKSTNISWSCEVKSTNKKLNKKDKKNSIKLSREQINNFLNNSLWQVFKVYGVNYKIEENRLIHVYSKPSITVTKIVRNNFIKMIHDQLKDEKYQTKKMK